MVFHYNFFNFEVRLKWPTLQQQISNHFKALRNLRLLMCAHILKKNSLASYYETVASYYLVLVLLLVATRVLPSYYHYTAPNDI